MTLINKLVTKLVNRLVPIAPISVKIFDYATAGKHKPIH